jgi:hypothetical protein
LRYAVAIGAASQQGVFTGRRQRELRLPLPESILAFVLSRRAQYSPSCKHVIEGTVLRHLLLLESTMSIVHGDRPTSELACHLVAFHGEQDICELLCGLLALPVAL